MENRRTELLRQLGGEEPTIGMAGSTTEVPGTSVDGPIADLETQLAALRVSLTDKHPDVQRVILTLADLAAIREKEWTKARNSPARVARQERSPVYQQMQVSLSNTEVELASLRTELAQRQANVAGLRRSVDTIPEVEAQLNRLDRDYTVVKSQYDALVQRLESARLSEEVQEDKAQVARCD